MATGRQTLRTIEGPPSRLESGLAVPSDGQLVAVGGERRVQLFGGADLAPIRTLPPHDTEVLAVALHPTEPLLAAVSDESLRLTDLGSGR